MDIRETFRTRLRDTMEEKWEKNSIAKLSEASGTSEKKDKYGNITEEPILSEAAIKSYRKENGRLPRIDTLQILAKALDVDMGYLIDENQTHRHREAQTISEATGLDQEAAERLQALITSHIPLFTDFSMLKCASTLCDAIEEYIHNDTHNDVFTIQDYDFLDEHTTKYVDKVTSSNMRKYVASDYFGRIIQHLFNAYDQIYTIRSRYEQLDNILDMPDGASSSLCEQWCLIFHDTVKSLHECVKNSVVDEYEPKELFYDSEMRSSLSTLLHYEFWGISEELRKRMFENSDFIPSSYVKTETTRYSPFKRTVNHQQ